MKKLYWAIMKPLYYFIAVIMVVVDIVKTPLRKLSGVEKLIKVGVISAIAFLVYKYYMAILGIFFLGAMANSVLNGDWIEADKLAKERKKPEPEVVVVEKTIVIPDNRRR